MLVKMDSFMSRQLADAETAMLLVVRGAGGLRQCVRRAILSEKAPGLLEPSEASSSYLVESPSLSPKPRLRQHRLSTWSVDLDSGLITPKYKSKPKSEPKCNCNDGNDIPPVFQTIIGLEIHAQLDISTKLFSGCPVPKSPSMRTAPNSAVWPLDAAIPGFLPLLSQEAVHAAVLTAASLKCQIPKISRFERKHYFYADIPLGYQMTQQRWPLARNGFLKCRRKNSKKKSTKMEETFVTCINRIQLEQDTGKTIATTNQEGDTVSLIDLNRAGCALVEIVFEPDLRSANDAATAVETLRNILRHIETCDGRMEEGSLRCDLNISIAPVDGSDNANNDNELLLSKSGRRVEVKNLNSMRQIQQAAAYEGRRQAEAFVSGSPTKQETRTFDVKSNRTVLIRSKDGVEDYRFMPEPDMPPLVLDEETFDGVDINTFISQNLPELPEEALRRLSRDYGLSDYLATVLTSDPPAISLFDQSVAVARKIVGNDNSRDYKRVPEVAANLICNELFALIREMETELKYDETTPTGSVKYAPVGEHQIGELVAITIRGDVSATMAKQILTVIYQEGHGKMPAQVAKERGFELIEDLDELRAICRKTINSNLDQLEIYKKGDRFARKIIKFYLGKAMASSRGNAHPERLNEILLEVLEEYSPGIEH